MLQYRLAIREAIRHQVGALWLTLAASIINEPDGFMDRSPSISLVHARKIQLTQLSVDLINFNIQIF
jgi:hypothetical protein